MKKINKKKVITNIIEFLILLIFIWFISKWQSRNLLDNKQVAPNFKLVSLDNLNVELEKSTGKYKVLYFFSPWCTVCNLSSHNISALSKRFFAKDIKIFAIGLSWSKIEDIREFQKKHELKVPVLIGNPEIQRDYKITSFPTIYILDKNNKIKDKVIGYTTEFGLIFRIFL